MAMNPSTTNPSALLALAERCEREEGGFYIDKEILKALGFTWRGMASWSADGKTMWKGQSHFTQSIDAAMDLMPEGWVLLNLSELGASGMNHARLGQTVDPCATAESDGAKTLALALSAACLRARAAIAKAEGR